MGRRPSTCTRVTSTPLFSSSAILVCPKLDGFNAFLKMKEINPAVKAIIATGYIDTEQRSAIFVSGVKDIMNKPYVPVEILHRIREVIDSSM